MPRFKVKWTAKGTAVIEADNVAHAQLIFDEIVAEEAEQYDYEFGRPSIELYEEDEEESET